MAEHVCPWWVGYLLVSPLRRLLQSPERILGPHVRAGMTVLEPGPGMGFFSLPLAQLVGPGGRVLCVDRQERMLRALAKRARRAGLHDRIETRVCAPSDLGLADVAGRVDFALAFAVVHETPDPDAFLAQIHAALAPGGRLLLAEPSGHVPAAAFRATVSAAEACGFRRGAEPVIRRSQSVLLEKAPRDGRAD